MSHYRRPHFRKIRRLKAFPGLMSKGPRARSDLRNQLRFEKKSQYCFHLEEKQKLHFHYGLQNDNHLNTFVSLKKLKGQ